MTISSTDDPRAGPFNGNGSQTAFPFEFKAFSKEDLLVVRTDDDGLEFTLVLDSDYSVTLNADQNADPGGTVTYPISGTALPAGETLTIASNLDYTQETDITNGGGFYPQVIEDALDRAVMLVKQVGEKVNRALRVAVSTPDDVDVTLPAPSAQKIIGWNDTATGLVNRDITDFATVVAFAAWQSQTFDGDGVTTAFTLSSDPGNINNLDIAIGGVTQTPLVDFTLSGTTLTFVVAPPAGTDNIFVRWGDALPQGTSTADQVGYDPLLSYVGRTIGAALNDQQAQMIWFVTDDTEKAAIRNGTSATDHTATIAAAMTLVGVRGLNFGASGWRWNISASLTPVSGATYSGKAKIRAINAAAITGAIFRAATAVSRVTIRDLELDANGDNNGANYGVWLTGGSYNLVDRVYVHDTRQAGIAIEAENGTDVLDCSILSCGRATNVSGAAATDNHGLMIFSSGATAVREIEARGNLVISAYRKGITTYSASPGTVVNVVISGNVVRTCGVTPSSGGGIYVANAVATTDQDAITLTGNICDGNYVNYEIANAKKVGGSGNVSKASVAQGVVVTTCADASLPGFSVSDSGTDGMLLSGCSQIVIGPIEIRRSNRTAAANGAGLHLSDSTYSTVSAGSVIFDETPLQKYAVLEDGASDYNDLSGVTVSGALTALYSMVGANTRVSGRTGRNTGVAKALPLNTLHIGGGLTIDEQALTLANGANQNVAPPANAGTLISNVPTGAYSIGGISGGHAGRILTIYNYTGFAMTLNHQDAGSLAANRFSCPSSANYVVPVQGTVQIQYSAIAGGSWFILG